MSFLYHIFSGFVCYVLYLAKISCERFYRTIGPLVYWIFFILAGNEDMHESLDKFVFRQICNRVTALDLRQNLVFAQYLGNE